MSENKDSKIVNHIFNVGLGTVVNIILGLITTPLITRIADPSEYGQLSVFNAYADIMLAFLYLGLDRSLMRFFYDDEDIKSKRSLLKICFVLPLVTTLVVTGAFVLLSQFGIIRSELTSLYIGLLTVYCVVSVWNKISTILLRVTYRTKEYSLCTVLQKIVYCLVILAYVFFINRNYFLMMVLASIISVALAAGYASISTKEYWKFIDAPLPGNTREILRFGLPFILYSCTEALLDSMDKLALDYYCTEFETGIYASAVSLVGIFLIVKTIFETIWIPMQTEHFVKNPDDPSFIQKGSLYLCIVLLFVGINVMMFKDMFCFILGSKYRDAAQIIPFLYLGSTFYAISDTTMCGIDMSKKSYLHAIAGVCACVVNLAGNTTLVPLLGSKGAALATCVSFLVYFVVRTYYSLKNYPIDYSLGKLFVVSIFVIGFAYINTFYPLGIYTFVSYMVVMTIFIAVYSRDIKELAFYLIGLVKEMLGMD